MRCFEALGALDRMNRVTTNGLGECLRARASKPLHPHDLCATISAMKQVLLELLHRLEAIGNEHEELFDSDEVGRVIKR